MSVPTITSDFAIIDVKRGRRELARFIGNGGKVLVRAEVLLDSVNSRDDGTSIEFSGSVTSISLTSVSEVQP